MKNNTMRRLIHTVTLLTWMYGCSAISAYAQSGTLVRDCCSGQLTTSDCQGAQCQCQRWIVEWPSLKMTETGRTIEEVIRKRDEFIRFEERWAKFIGRSVDERYRDTNGPICDTCRHNSTTRDWTNPERIAWENGRLLLGEWESKLRQAASQFVRATEQRNPFSNVGGALQDYARALSDTQRKLKALNSQLICTEQTMRPIIGNVDIVAQDFNIAASKYEQAFNALPKEAKDFLEGEQVSGFAGQWRYETGATMSISVKGSEATVTWADGRTSVETIKGNSFRASSPILIAQTFSEEELGKYRAECRGFLSGREAAYITKTFTLSKDGNTITAQSSNVATSGRCEFPYPAETSIWYRVSSKGAGVAN